MSFRTHIILAVLVFLIASLCILHPVHAQYTVDGEDFTLVSPIRIGSPSNTTYAANHVDLNFTVKTFVDCHINNMTLVYSLDMKDNVTIPIIVVDVEDVVIDANGRGSIWAGPIWDKEHLKFYVVDAEDFVVDDDDGREVINLIIGVVNLENLQKGSHSLTVYGIYSTHQSQKIGYDKQTVYFTTTGDATDPPIVTTDPPIVTTDPPIVTTDPPIATIYVLVVVVVILLIIFMFFILFTKWKRE
ncbi:MAG: hypothetical protein LBU83_07455 [Bacteroidales bacterium]|jgi:hypothetical protein|nr:hypothetical protein [Bacteroidales bacterium]